MSDSRHMHGAEATGDRRENRLGKSTSPYLLQHRTNPVDWYPWGQEAFDAARARDVPIFLSVGYSTCYWCHVMERESFENEGIAQLMNEHFVCIKVDREERPDVDDIYMAAVQAFTERGGWPMSVFLEPKFLRPFWAGTYFPAEPGGVAGRGMPTFPQVLRGMSKAFAEQRAEIEQQAAQLADAVRERVAEQPTRVRLDETKVSQAIAQLLRLHDRARGGFGGAPKFPQPVFLDLLLASRQAAGDAETRDAIDAATTKTLRAMALGGMFDQVGGGFHRYSVDAQWLVPHFEKMLYDNGALAETYARAYSMMPDPLFKRTAERICMYMLREMTSAEGGLYAAQDAEVNHREGENYLWTMAQVVEVLGPEDGAWISRVYGLDRGTNFQDPHHPDEPPSNVLFVPEDDQSFWSDDAQVHRLDALNARLYAARAKRDQPGLDDKIIASWNGLAIAGLAWTGAICARPDFIAAARRAADCVLRVMLPEPNKLQRVYAQGRAGIDAPLEDYALLGHGLVALARALGPIEGKAYVAAAAGLAEAAMELFGDDQGGVFDTAADRPDLFVRTRSVYDGAMASGTSVLVHVLIDLASLTGQQSYAKQAAELLASVSGSVAEAPLGSANSTRALLRLLSAHREVLNRAMEELGPRGEMRHDAEDFSPVEVLSELDAVTVGLDQPAAVRLRLRIAPGYHLTAAVPQGNGADGRLVGLTPLRVHVVGGSGIKVYADYPRGTQMHTSNAEEPRYVYEGELDLTVVIEREGTWRGTPLIALTYQACTQTECLRARTVELSVSIERA